MYLFLPYNSEHKAALDDVSSVFPNSKLISEGN